MLKNNRVDKNGWTKTGEVAGDYIAAGRDPDLPRITTEEIAEKLGRFLAKKDDDAFRELVDNYDITKEGE